MLSGRHLRFWMFAAGAGHISAGSCPRLDPLGPVEPSAVHVVFGPLPMDGDPRVTHHLEHILVDELAHTCGVGSVGELDGWTGPDTLHLVWRGRVDASELAGVARVLSSLHPSVDDLDRKWTGAAEEIALERILTEPSPGGRLLTAAGPGARYRLPLRGAVAYDPDALDVLVDAPVTTIIARGDGPVQWRHGGAVPDSPATLAVIDNPPHADRAWSVDGTLGCDQQRALWAAVAGVAEAMDGTPLGWLGWRGGVVGVSDAGRTRWSMRAALAAAEQWDAAAVRMTGRRARELGDQTWMVAGHLGLGVCPSMEPLDRAVLNEAVSWLARPGTLSVGDTPAGSGSLDLDRIDWAAVWQAGEPPEAWLDSPELYGTRTPGGFTLDGPVETLSRAALPTPAAALVSLDDPIEQALVLMGAEAVQVPCRVTGMDRACTTTGQLRRPRGHSLVVVDQPDAVAVHIDLVGALSEAPGSVRVARATYGPHSAVGRALRRRARARDHVMQVEPVRFRSSVRVSMDHAAAVVGWFSSPEAVAGSEAVPWSVGHDGVMGVWESRLEARPWERVHEPMAQVERGPPSSGRAMGTLLVIRGPAERLRTELAASGVVADRVLSAAQLAAEARSIRPLGAKEAP